MPGSGSRYERAADHALAQYAAAWAAEPRRAQLLDEDDALAYPDAMADMALALIQCHSTASDKSTWQKLLLSIREAANKIEDLDLSDLD